jgi:hypothetical protein
VDDPHGRWPRCASPAASFLHDPSERRKQQQCRRSSAGVQYSGNTYNEISDGTGVPQWISYLRNVKPAESAQGNVLFDAPPRHYKLKIQDEDSEKAALIDIPLNFGAESPDIIPTPEKKQ